MVGSAPESSRQVSNGAASAIAARLSRVPDLKLPGQLTRDRPVSEARKTDYLMKLILHDPGVFLERHGDILEAEEFAAFQPLRSSSYEVDFHLKILEDRRNNPPQNRETLSNKVKNRRLAAMRNLMLEGEHFSEEAMRHRQPYLYHLHVGQYACTVVYASTIDASQEGEGNEEGGGGGSGEGSGIDNEGGASVPLEATTLARSLMRQQEEVDLMVRREEERGRYDEIEREQEEESEDENEKDTTEADKVKIEKDKGVVGDAEKEEAAGGGEIVLAGPEENAEPLDERNPSWWGGPSGERITQEERENNLESFRDIMQQKFLAGEDTGTINYVAIDANQELDLSEEAVRDAEEAYFDTD